MSPLVGAGHGLLGQQDARRQLGLRQAHAHILAGQQQAISVGYFCAQCDLAAGGVYRQVREQQLAGLGQLGAVFQHHAHGHGAIAGRAQLLAGNRFAQAQHVGAALGEIHKHGGGLLDYGQLGGLRRTDQRAFGDQRLANTARDGRGDRGIGQADARGFHGGLGGAQVGFSLALRGDQRGVFLLADGVGFHQRLVAFDLGRGLGQIGLGLGDAGLGAFHGGAVGGSVDLVQHLAGLHFAAFTEQALQHHSVHAGTHLRHTGSAHAAGQFGLQGDGLGRYGDYTHFSRRHAATRATGTGGTVLGTAGDQRHSHRNRQQGNAAQRQFCGCKTHGLAERRHRNPFVTKMDRKT